MSHMEGTLLALRKSASCHITVQGQTAEKLGEGERMEMMVQKTAQISAQKGRGGGGVDIHIFA